MKTRSSVWLSIAAFALASSAFAAPETFNIDSSHTFSRFSYNHLGYSTQQSRFNQNTGKIVYDQAAKTGSVNVTIDMKSVDTGSNLFNGHIQAEGFLDTEKFPTATFVSTKVNFDGDKPVSVDGNLTIKGVTKPVTLTLQHFHRAAHPMMKKDVIGANAVTKIKRSEFNAGKLAPFVGDEVTIEVSVEAIKE